MKYAIGCLVIIVLFVVICIITAMGSYNGLVNASQRVDKQWAQVQTVYQRRADLIPNLVQTVSGAAHFEKSTLVAVTNARASVGKVNINANSAPSDPAQLQAFEQAQGNLSSALSHLMVVVENYPNLQSDRNFVDLQAQIEGAENRIAHEREGYNEVVQDYNARVQRFPTMIFARMFGFATKPYFNATPEAQTAPQVHFDFNNTTAPAQ
ncbi:MAG TPA: LemA family protein [Tepidisphaeraceae bacterium]|jgi:LemA protein